MRPKTLTIGLKPRKNFPDPDQSVESPQTTSHAVAGDERGSAGLRMRMEEGQIAGGTVSKKLSYFVNEISCYY